MDMTKVIQMCREIREQHKLPLKQPLLKLWLFHSEPVWQYQLRHYANWYLRTECNVKSVQYMQDWQQWFTYTVKPDMKALVSRLGGQSAREVQRHVARMTFDDVAECRRSDGLMLDAENFVLNEEIHTALKPVVKHASAQQSHKRNTSNGWINTQTPLQEVGWGMLAIVLDTTVTSDLQREYEERLAHAKHMKSLSAVDT